MKLQISVGQPPLAGFLNIDATTAQVDLGNLEGICEAAECTEILINDVLKFMPYEKLPEVIHHISSRMRHGAKLTLIFTDVNSVIREYNRGAVDEKLLNQLVFNGARSAFSYDYMVRIIQAVRLELLEVNISKEQVIITAKRP
jgi:hypothetical protein